MEGALADLLARIVDPDRILSRPIDVIAYASDASFYRLIMRAVVQTRTVEEIQALFRFSHEHRVPLTFRAAGTSLSGQAITDGILVEVGRYWRQVKVEEGGKKVRVQPGVIDAHVNHALRPRHAKIGPDPASINTAMAGGILANNPSGMCCGVTQNAYHTLDSLTFVPPSGTVIDTADPRADLLTWMEQHEYESIRQMQGSMSHRSVANPAAFERANYIKVLSSYVLKS